ncbi:C1 family peptidase [[Eubacterium] cellulosolvens]
MRIYRFNATISIVLIFLLLNINSNLIVPLVSQDSTQHSANSDYSFEKRQFAFQSNEIENSQESYTIMKPDKDTLKKWSEHYKNAKSASKEKGERFEGPITQGLSFSLLDHLNYVPNERSQGLCGNCWVWASTGVMEIALDVQNGVYDRLSIQYFTSCYNGGTGTDWACCGGSLYDFSSWYQNIGFAIPWSNTNAHWQDMGRRCSGGTSVPCGTISTFPNYPISLCQYLRINTYGYLQEDAINNIKSVLHQNKAVCLSFFLPTDQDWDLFYDFWLFDGEDEILSLDYSCEHEWVEGEGGGHAVLCVGYDETDPDNRYWIMVNSWGTALGNRPNGVFHLDMDMNYSCTYYRPYPTSTFQSFWWQTLDITYNFGVSTNFVSMLNFDDYNNRMGSLTAMEPATTFYFPHFHQDSSWQTYYSLANPQTSSADITITYYRADGTQLPPESFSLSAGHKIGSFSASGTGWIKVESSVPIVGMLNFDDYNNRMGSMPGVTPSDTLYFPHFHQDSNWQTFGVIVNPNGIGAYITLNFNSSGGSTISTDSFTLDADHKRGRFAVIGTGWIETIS